MKEQYGLQLEIDTKHDFAHLPDHIRVTLFQAVREMLFNVVKHAGILQAKVTLEQVDEHGQILISDSGNGFDAATVMADSQLAHRINDVFATA